MYILFDLVIESFFNLLAKYITSYALDMIEILLKSFRRASYKDINIQKFC